MTTTLAIFFEVSRTVDSMVGVGLALLVIGILAARSAVAQASGLDKVVAIANLCFALPLAIFGALHLAAAPGLATMVPSFIPWHLFWAYFVGLALIAASLSIATSVQVRWSGLMFGVMMFIFVATMDAPGVYQTPRDRITDTLMMRELCFGAGGWVLAGTAMGVRGRGRTLITIGRILIGLTALVFAYEQLLHPLGMPAVPLEKEMPTWIPLRAPIGYITGVMLLLAGLSFLAARKVREAATYLGSWIVLLIALVYVPVMIAGLINPSTDAQVEGLNYFGDTLLFGGVILALAQATRSSASSASGW